MARSAPSRGRARRGSRRGAATSRPRTRASGQLGTSDVPDVFHDILAETAAPTDGEEPERPLKRRRTAAKEEASSRQTTKSPSSRPAHLPPPQETADAQQDDEHTTSASRLQTIIDDSEDTEDDSDMEWEEVMLDKPPETVLRKPERELGDLSIVWNSNPEEGTPARKVRRKGITSADKKVRLDVHKVHVLCLLYHAYVRNAWCNDRQLQTCLKRFLTKRIITDFAPDPDRSQPQAARAFMDGLNQAKEAWSPFKVTKKGTRRARWSTSEALENYKLPEDVDPPIGLSELRKAAVAFEGSADTGAQLFCAFLRAAGVEARLVCSLQSLPFSAALQPPLDNSPYPQKPIFHAETPKEAKGPAAESLDSASPIPKRIKRMGQSSKSSATPVAKGAPPPSVYKKTIEPPRHPVFWVEAFNIAHQKWIAVDPISTMTVGKPLKLEPPLSSSEVSMAYVIAYERTGVAKDVTRRYASSYNAKTRRHRVETTENGAKWWRKAMKIFRRETILDRDQVEDGELSKKEAAEPMPSSVQDFKHHPYYALERHLRHNEVIHPRREVGKVNAGSAAVSKLEPIYRRRDVHACKSADKWYRLGRDIKAGEQPLKHAKPRPDRARDLEMDDGHSGDGEQLGAGLYAPFQTELYVPPPVVAGRIPRNVFGNLDIYVPSMVPGGAVHVRTPDAAKAARLLGIDYADAVTGFQFKGRHGTAVIQGAVVAYEHGAAVEEVIRGFAYVQDEEQARKRSQAALRAWRRFLTGLRIVERVQSYATDAEREAMREELDKVEDEQDSATAAGGFFPDAAEPTVPTAENGAHANIFRSNTLDGQTLPSRRASSAEKAVTGLLADEGAGGFSPDAEMAGGFLPHDNEGGGFIADEPAIQYEHVATEQMGGFLPDASPDAASDDMNEGGGFIIESDAHNQDQEQSKVMENDEVTQGVSTSMASPDETSPKAASPAQADVASSNNASGQPEPEANAAEGNTLRHEEINRREEEQENADEAQASSEDEKGSLPSQDPEDEDAEPEWLMTSD